jgi:two-component system, cell cycle sensor histidine kinase and response regulator CckA
LGQECNERRRVLVIDDEEIVRNLTKSILESFDYEALLAKDGETGLDLYSRLEAEIGLVLCDMMMPTMSGEDVFYGLRALNPKALVLLSSGLEDPELIDRLTARGLAGFIKKPYRPVQLMARVRDLLARGTNQSL